MAEKQENKRPRVNLRGVGMYLDLLEAPRVERRRQFFLVTALALAVAALSVAIVLLIPLKERVPYFIEVEASTGRVALAGQIARQFTPDEAAVRYFLSRWVVDAWTIDESLRPRLIDALSLLRGDAVHQFDRLVLVAENPLGLLKRNPNHRRSVEITAPPQIVAVGSVIVRINLTEGRNVVGRRQVSLRYAILPPTSDEDVLRNPIGLWITDISVVNESL